MDLRQTPTRNDLAKMLDSIAVSADGAYPETLHVMRWLIESSPEARAIYDRLYARRDREPALIELARLMIAVKTGERYPEAVYTVQWLIERSPEAQELYWRLRRMARDAGIQDRDPDWAIEAFELHQELDRLLANLDDWQDAGEALELDMDRDYAFRYLLNICRARSVLSHGDEKQRLEQLRRRLQDAARRAARNSDPETHLSELVSSLRSMFNPALTLETVEELIRRLRA